MSAWYVLSACGIHPVCPGETRFEIAGPTFDRADIFTGSNKIFSVIAVNNSSENVYIQSATLNGEKYGKCYIDYQDILKGGSLKLVMGNKPNMNWGTER
jgi:putative alpha-1,2-mannosidase